MISDPQFWVAIAFIIFLVAIFRPVKKILSSTLDTKINAIKESIDEADNLKNETQVILNNIKKRQNEVELEIKEIESNAKERIKILESQSNDKLSEQIKKRELLTNLKIDQLLRDINLSIKQNISETAIEATMKILEKKLDEKEKLNLINRSVEDISKILKN